MQLEMVLAERLIRALDAGEADVDPAPFAGMTLDAARTVQALVQTSRGETPLVVKTALSPGGAVAAPIFRSMIHPGTQAAVPSRLVVGLEVEVAVILARDLAPSDVARDGEDAVRAAIDRFIVGVELIGSRFRERSAAGAMAMLADNLSSAGYVTDVGRTWQHGADLAGVEVEVTHDARTLFAAPARHGFGSVLASLVAYAREPCPSLPLKAGLIVTTGSVCGLVDVPGPGRIRARLGEHSLDLVLS